jgi:hypothetical protein
MNFDYSYCNEGNLNICKTCKRNINLYSYNLNRNIWMLTPIIKNNKCENYQEKW